MPGQQYVMMTGQPTQPAMAMQPAMTIQPVAGQSTYLQPVQPPQAMPPPPVFQHVLPPQYAAPTMSTGPHQLSAPQQVPTQIMMMPHTAKQSVMTPQKLLMQNPTMNPMAALNHQPAVHMAGTQGSVEEVQREIHSLQQYIQEAQEKISGLQATLLEVVQGVSLPKGQRFADNHHELRMVNPTARSTISGHSDH